MALGRYEAVVDLQDLMSAKIDKIVVKMGAVQQATMATGVQTSLFGEKIKEITIPMRQVEDRLETISNRARRFGGVITNLSIMSFVLHLMFNRMAHSTERVKDAQERYNEVVAKFGPASLKAEQALRNLKLAQDDLTMAQREQMIQFVLFSGMFLTLIPEMILSLRNFIAWTRTATIAQATLKAVAAVPALPIVGVAALGVAAVGAYAFGAYAAPAIAEAVTPRRIIVSREEGIDVAVSKTPRYIPRELEEYGRVAGGT